MNKNGVASFDLNVGGRYVDGDWAIYPSSLLFKAGTYADKDFSMSAEELLAACEQFTPVDGNIEHTSFLDGRACQVRSVYLDDEDNTILRGVVAVPTWLDEQLSSAERKLSCEWDRDTKMLSGVGLVVHPRIPEAALMNAYADFARPKRHTPTGQRHLQMLHDMTVERGATCKSDAQMSEFASTHEARAIQQIHDTTVEHGAACEKTMNEGERGSTYAPLLYNTPPKEKKKMGIDFKALFSGLFGAIEERESAAAPIPPVTPPVLVGANTSYPTIPAATTVTTASGASQPPLSPIVDPRVAELEKLVAERDATIAKEAEARIQREAAIFAEEMVRAQKAAPAEQEKLAAAFAQAMRDDQRHDAVTFKTGDGQESKTSRVQQLRDVYEARPAGLLTQEMLPPNQDGAAASALFNQQTTPRTGPDGKPVPGEMSAERRRALLEGSSLGRAVVRDQTASGKNGHGS